IEVTETGIEVIPRLLGVLHVTVGATVAGFLLALILGLMLAFGRRSKNRIVSGLTGGVVEFVRLTPLLVQLYFIYFVMPEIGLTLSAFTAGVLGLGIHYAAYISEGPWGFPGKRRRSGRRAYWRRWGCWTRSISIRPTCREDNSSGWPSPGRW